MMDRIINNRTFGLLIAIVYIQKYNTLYTHTLYWHVLTPTSYRIKHKNIAFEFAPLKPLFQKRYFWIKGKF